MAVSRHSIIAKEGQAAVLLSGIVAFALHLQFGYWAAPAWLVTALLAWLYRDPSRSIPARPLSIVSPVDGRVSSVEPAVTDRFLQREALHIALDMSLGGVFSVRSVTEGKVMQLWQDSGHDGKRLAIWIQTDEQEDIVLVLRPGRWLKRLSYQPAYGDRIGHGQRIGHILFGSRVDVYLPASARSTIEVGRQVRGGSDTLAEFLRS